MAPFLPKRPAWSRRSTRSGPTGERRTENLTLHATEPDEPTIALGAVPDSLPVSWPLAAALAGLLVAGVSWVIVAGLSVVGWLAADAETVAGSLSQTLLFGTQLWVFSNGAGLAAGGLHLTLIPWGTVALFAFLLAKTTGFAAARTGRSAGDLAFDDPAGGDRAGGDRAGGEEPASRRATGIGLLSTFGYIAPLAVVALLLGAPLPSPQLLVAFVVLLGGALWGACRALDVDPTARWPRWLRPVPTAVLGSQLVLLAAGAAVVVAGLLLQLDRVTMLTDALDGGIAGNIALLFGQLAFAPNVLVWGAAYALGAGFGLGDGSVVAPAATQVGLLPGIPIFGAVPASGPGGVYQLLWLTAGVVAGLVAAGLVVRRRPAARFDETALVGGLSGVLGGLVFTGLAWACAGDLGVARLSGMGPRLPELVVMSVSTLGLSGMIGGLLLGLWRRRPQENEDPAAVEADPDPEATIDLDREEVLSASR
jgi:hypothetical protein